LAGEEINSDQAISVAILESDSGGKLILIKRFWCQFWRANLVGELVLIKELKFSSKTLVDRGS
jgi:hypothetical protein